MSTQDESAFADYLQGKSSVSARYRQLQNDQLQHDEVPPALDQQVLQQARAALQSPAANEPSFWARWNKPLAMAASLLVITSVIIKLGQQSRIEPQFTQQSPAVETKIVEEIAPPAIATPEVALGNTQEAKTVVASRDEATANRQAQPAALADAASLADTALGRSAAEAIAPPPPALNLPVVAAPSAPAPAETSAERREQDNTARGNALQKVATSIATAERPTAAAAQSPVATVGAVRSLNTLRTDEELTSDPARWLEQIRELRAQSKSVEADAAWVQFRKAWPEYVVSIDDKARPASP